MKIFDQRWRKLAFIRISEMMRQLDVSTEALPGPCNGDIYFLRLLWSPDILVPRVRIAASASPLKRSFQIMDGTQGHRQDGVCVLIG